MANPPQRLLKDCVGRAEARLHPRRNRGQYPKNDTALPLPRSWRESARGLRLSARERYSARPALPSFHPRMEDVGPETKEGPRNFRFWDGPHLPPLFFTQTPTRRTQTRRGMGY